MGQVRQGTRWHVRQETRWLVRQGTRGQVRQGTRGQIVGRKTGYQGDRLYRGTEDRGTG